MNNNRFKAVVAAAIALITAIAAWLGFGGGSSSSTTEPVENPPAEVQESDAS